MIWKKKSFFYLDKELEWRTNFETWFFCRAHIEVWSEFLVSWYCAVRQWLRLFSDNLQLKVILAIVLSALQQSLELEKYRNDMTNSHTFLKLIWDIFSHLNQYLCFTLQNLQFDGIISGFVLEGFSFQGIFFYYFTTFIFNWEICDLTRKMRLPFLPVRGWITFFSLNQKSQKFLKIHIFFVYKITKNIWVSWSQDWRGHRFSFTELSWNTESDDGVCYSAPGCNL